MLPYLFVTIMITIRETLLHRNRYFSHIVKSAICKTAGGGGCQRPFLQCVKNIHMGKGFPNHIGIESFVLLLTKPFSLERLASKCDEEVQKENREFSRNLSGGSVA